MKQIMQDMANGETRLVSAPSPRASSGTAVICSRVSLVSAGTERMLVDFGRASYLRKARQQPDKVRMVLEKVRTDGLFTTLDAVRSKLAQPLPLGYCNVGVIADLGSDMHPFKEGDRVVSNGPHSDVVKVSKQLMARIPETVTDESAAFTVVASIGLQGIRLAAPTLGEAFVVIGTGLIGLLTIQLLKAHGCRVLAVDLDDSKLALASKFGAETCNPSKGQDPVALGLAFSRHRGVDGVLICASTASDQPVSQAAQMCRKRGRIVLVGVTGLKLNRAEFYEKELSFQVSCSYGPGRYDAAYEQDGVDYPVGFVRWTEQRNFEAILDMMASGQLDTETLITHRYSFSEMGQAYSSLTTDKSGLGILLHYPSQDEDRLIDQVSLSTDVAPVTGEPVIAVIGAGNYASRMLLPALKKSGAQFKTILSNSGISGVIQGEKQGFAVAASDEEVIWKDTNIDGVVIATRHNSHASLVSRALSEGKHVFVEKPLAIDDSGLASVREAYTSARLAGHTRQLMVGFNRRFAPQTVKMKSLLGSVPGPKVFIMTMNAGELPANHWTHDLEVGGGRMIGEACHFIDLMRFLADSRITEVQATRMGPNDYVAITEDKAVITLRFENGSFGTIFYLANGAASYPKERIEVFTSGKVLQLDNFRKLKGFGWPGFSSMNLWKQDKGQDQCAAAWLASLRSGKSAIPVDEIFEVAEATLQSAMLLRSQ
ncbi:bi-domain-containing oxidoreductase [Pseudomonas sp. KNUC1026]|uniref:bi-domain-containing oxidoreductase n=1 Tax=Pseudomonas sp. KNUC1026 TaxID=2893890 RepID=UPI001F3E6E11|nr:bi-domain-containing oxidoreductase [Pseudomonas sp. KNUC1026]UFH48241.1 bi-domain-containing oxidoreductase [Pseudomonas sp. KNUC1026]